MTKKKPCIDEAKREKKEKRQNKTGKHIRLEAVHKTIHRRENA